MVKRLEGWEIGRLGGWEITRLVAWKFLYVVYSFVSLLVLSTLTSKHSRFSQSRLTLLKLSLTSDISIGYYYALLPSWYTGCCKQFQKKQNNGNGADIIAIPDIKGK